MKRPDPFMLARTTCNVTSGQQYIPRSVQGIQILAKWKQGQTGENAWLARIIATGFQRLRAMHLPGQPAAEMLPVTAQMWVDVLLDMRVTEELDLTRIETGFRYLFRSIREWPQPADLLKEMPKRVEGRRDPRDVSVRRERSEEENTEALEAINEMKSMFNRRKA